MKEKRVVEMNLDDFEFGYTPKDNENEYYRVPSDKFVEEASKDLQCNPEVLRAIVDNLMYLKDLLKEDLLDLYKLAVK